MEAAGTILKVFGMTHPGIEPMTFQSWGGRTKVCNSTIALFSKKKEKKSVSNCYCNVKKGTIPHLSP